MYILNSLITNKDNEIKQKIKNRFELKRGQRRDRIGNIELAFL